MEFDRVTVKDNPGLCRCCLSEGCYKDLSTMYLWMNESEIYADMLFECFDISISQHMDGPNGPNRLICEVCITRLRDACNFKKQVLDSEKKFVEMLARGDFARKVVVYQNDLKAELQEMILDPDTANTEYLGDDVDYSNDDLMNPDEPTTSVSEGVTAAPLALKAKRGRPRKKPEDKVEKKIKTKTEQKLKKSRAIVKGKKLPVVVTHDKALTKSSMSAKRRNQLMKRNATLVLEASNVTPFKWCRQNYLCFYCPKIFNKPQQMKQHTFEEHKKTDIKMAVSYLRSDEKVKIDVIAITCKLCSENLDDLDSLVAHLKDTHGKVFADEHGYGLVPYKLADDNFECAVCKEKFQYFVKLNQHMNDHCESYMCEACGKCFLSQVRLRCHYLRHRSRFRCNICSETFDSLTLKNDHEKLIHNKDRSVKCFYCDENFPNPNQRKSHHISIHGMEASHFNCPVCAKPFHILSKMWLHVKAVHRKEKNYSCSICDQMFFSKAHVQKHLIKHTGEKIYQCEVCKKSYQRKQTLRDHMRIHNNDKRFACAVCSQAFVQNNSLKLHMKVHHKDGQAN